MANRAPKQNLSGHVCFDVPTTRFFQEVYDGVHKMEVRRRHGLLQEKRDRNPLKAEKSPRKVESFEYRPPAGLPKEERWNYPDSDWGLMAKFRSQKGIYDEIFHKEAEYQKKVDQVAQIREENQKMIEAEFLRQKNQYALAKKQKEEADQQRFNSIMSMDISGNRGQPGSASHQDGPDELDLALQHEAKAAAKLKAERMRKNKDPSRLLATKKETAPSVDFCSTHISSFKVIGDKQPEVLAEWRAQRAAEFVSKNARSLEVPKHRELGKNFRPGGILPAKTANFTFAKQEKAKPKPIPLLKPVDPTALDIGTLKQALQNTEEQMQRQLLKIKLNSKPPKHYEVGKHTHRPNSRGGRNKSSSTSSLADSPY